jgi:hypothetical protein
MNQDMSIVSLLLEASFVVQLVVLILLGISVSSWAAIVRKLNPACGFVLIDKIEQMDLATLRTFGAWLQAEGLQAITTRVSRGDECSIIIEAGAVSEVREPQELSFA